MASYMFQISYTSEAWGAQVKNPQNRLEAVTTVIEGLGGSVETAYFTFGDYDVVLICGFPDNVSAAALAITISGGGAVKTFKTTPLMTIEEGLESLRKAGGSGYRPPGS